nr:molybdopterin-binding protein [Ardenticatena sp.]
MQIERVSPNEAVGHILMHSVVDAEGRKAIKKGTRLTPDHAARLRDLGVSAVEVAILAPNDVHEDIAAERLAAALATPTITMTRGVGGRVNLQTRILGVLRIEPARLLALNAMHGITLATRPNYTVVAPERGRQQIATLKIIPYAIPRELLEAAERLARTPPRILDVHPLPMWRVALLISGDPAAHARLRQQFEPPTATRVQRLGSQLATVVCVPHTEQAIAEAAATLLATHDALITAGQTSIMDTDDVPLRALRAVGAEVAVHGAPVEPGNLLALAYWQGKPILCAPGCAKSLSYNVVDLVLPRLFIGEKLGPREIAALGMGGLLRGTSAERQPPVT